MSARLHLLPQDPESRLERVRLLRDGVASQLDKAKDCSKLAKLLAQGARETRVVDDMLVTAAKTYAEGARAAVEIAEGLHGELRKECAAGESIAMTTLRASSARYLGAARQYAGNARAQAQRVEGIVRHRAQEREGR